MKFIKYKQVARITLYGFDDLLRENVRYHFFSEIFHFFSHFPNFSQIFPTFPRFSQIFLKFSQLFPNFCDLVFFPSEVDAEIPTWHRPKYFKRDLCTFRRPWCVMSACHGTKSKFGKIWENWENLGKSGKINDILGKKTTFWERKRHSGKMWGKIGKRKIFPKSQVGKEN